MSKWNVLMETTDFIEVEAATHEEAAMKAFEMYRKGEIDPPDNPIFVCEKCDLIDDEDELDEDEEELNECQ